MYISCQQICEIKHGLYVSCNLLDNSRGCIIAGLKFFGILEASIETHWNIKNGKIRMDIHKVSAKIQGNHVQVISIDLHQIMEYINLPTPYHLDIIMETTIKTFNNKIHPCLSWVKNAGDCSHACRRSLTGMTVCS